MITEVVYLSRDNTIDLILRANRVAQNITQLTKVWLVMTPDEGTAITIKSDEEASEVFDWTSEGVSGKLKLKLGGLTELVGKTGIKYETDIIVFDAVNDDGIHWDTISIAIN